MNTMEEVCGETSIARVPCGKRSRWFFLDGPVSLLNHSCENYNAQYRFDIRDPHGCFAVEVLEDVGENEEITVHYGDEFWGWAKERFGLQCICDTCCCPTEEAQDKGE